MNLLFILLSILKFIGIILLVLLLVLLILMLIILFAPIKYNGYFKKDTDLEASASLSWFFNVISYTFLFKDGNIYNNFKYPKFEFMKKLFKPKKIKKSKKEKTDDNNIEYKDKNNRTENTEEKKEIKNENFLKENIEKKSDKPKEEKIKSKKNKKIKKNKFNLHKNNGSSKIDEIKSIIYHRDKDIAIKALKRILKAIKPKKFKLDLIFGFDNPFQTGILLGFLSMIMYPMPFKINIKGNFEQEVLLADIETNGETNFWLLGSPLLVFIIKKLYRDNFRKEEKK